MARRLLLLLFLSLVVLIPALLSTPAKAGRLESLQQKIANARAEEARLSSEIGSIEAEIRALQREVSGVAVRLDHLERDLRLQQEKLNRVRRLYSFQTEQLDFLRREYNVSVRRLNLRLIELYEGDDPTTLDVFLSSDSISEFLEHVDYVQDIVEQDARISTQVGHAKDDMHAAREKTKVTKAKVETVTRTIAARTAEVRAEKERLLISEQGLSQAKGNKRDRLVAVRKSKEEYLHEVAGLLAANAQVTATIQSAGSMSYDSTPSSSGLIWPVSGPVVSGYGMRWGRMHMGIDIGAGYGTPIVASASGTVIFAGWMGGYGNFVIVDHGGGLSTAYAHQSSIAVGGGAVSQGQVLGYVGCTGHCFGPHLHFEVRVNGSAVDPLGYL
jgi:murein DD-endopeptidase MepM/ murein hydrolase activator NlpD